MGSVFWISRMITYLIISIILGTLVQGETGVEDTKPATIRDKKLFSLFTVVTFPNNECTAKSSTSSTKVYGTCLTQSECTGRSGLSDGNCAAGFGICCTITKTTCGSVISENRTYIQNPKYPTAEGVSFSCTYTVNPVSSDICQLRLDFDFFDLTESTTTGSTYGACLDSFTMTGPTGRNPMNLCGTLTGMHVYIEQGRSTTATTLKFATGTAGGGSWKMKVSQIECHSLARANPDCNQWFTGISGVVQSYNWPNVMLQARHFNTCIRREKGYCGLSLARYAASTPCSFCLDDTTTNGLAQNGLAGSQGFLQIPGVDLVNHFSGYSFCYHGFGKAAISSPAQLASGCSSDGTLETTSFSFDFIVPGGVDNTGELGYKLSYNQVPCGLGTFSSTTVQN